MRLLAWMHIIQEEQRKCNCQQYIAEAAPHSAHALHASPHAGPSHSYGMCCMLQATIPCAGAADKLALPRSTGLSWTRGVIGTTLTTVHALCRLPLLALPPRRLVTRQGPIEALTSHLSDPLNNNIIWAALPACPRPWAPWPPQCPPPPLEWLQPVCAEDHCRMARALCRELQRIQMCLLWLAGCHEAIGKYCWQ